MPDDMPATLMALIVPIIHRPCPRCGRPEPARTGDQVDCSTCLDSGSAGPIFDKADAEEYAARIAAAMWAKAGPEMKRLRRELGRERKKARANRQAQQDRANQAEKTVERLRAELASAKLDHIADHDDATGELAKVDVEVERLTKVLAEMTALRDNAVRAAEHADQSIDVDLEGLVGDGLASLGVEWDGGENGAHPKWLETAVIDLVRPVIAHAVKRAEQAEADLEAANHFLSQHGPLLHRAEIAEAERDALRTARCPSCDHLTSGHQQDGCWYSVTLGTAGRDPVCPCTVPPAALDHPTDTTGDAHADQD